MSRSNPNQPDPETPLRSNSAMSVCADEFRRMSEEEQAFLRSLAEDMLNKLEDTEKALAQMMDDQLFDVEEGVAMWSVLPAKVRTAIKRGNELRKPKTVCTECGLLGTHTRACSIGGRFA